MKIPLLRDQVQASQTRRAAALAGALLALAAIGGAVYMSSGTDGDVDEPVDADEVLFVDAGVDIIEPAAIAVVEDAPSEAAPTMAPGEPVAEGAVERKLVLFGAARSFRHALTAAGLTKDEGAALEISLQGKVDFRRCRPEDRMFIERDALGSLVRFEYHASELEYVVSSRSATGAFVSEKISRPVARIRVARAGRVTTSIGDALSSVGLGRALVGVFIDAFGAKANFSTDTRDGDTFRIIVDEERLNGELLRYGRVHALEYEGSKTGTLRAFYYEATEGDGDFYDDSGRAMHGSWMRTPCHYDHISSPFDPNRLHPILRRRRPHNGVDYAAGTGTPVWAAAAGVITFAGMKGANGNLVGIQHDNGYSSYYAHLHRIAPGIQRGVRVSARQAIGQVGTTGRSTGPHLHFGVKRGGTFVDPLDIINGPGQMLPNAHRAPYRRVQRAKLAELRAIPLP